MPASTGVMGRGWFRQARINFRLLLVLSLVVMVLGTGAVGLHYLRKRSISAHALAAGQAAFDKQDWATAGREFEIFLERHPNDIEVLKKYGIAWVSVKTTNREESQDAIRKAIAGYHQLHNLDPNNEEYFRQLLRLYIRVDTSAKWGAIERLCVQWLKQVQDDAYAQLWLAKALNNQNNRADAARQLLDLLTKHPDQEHAYIMLSDIVLKEGPERAPIAEADTKETAARAWLDVGVKAMPQSAQILAYRASLFLRINDKLAAEADMKAADALQSPNPTVRLLLFDLWTNLGQSADQQDCLTRAAAELAAIENLDPQALIPYEVDYDTVVYARFMAASELYLRRQGSKKWAEEAREKGIDLADRGLQELNDYAWRSFVPAAVDLYLVAGETEKARQAIESYRKVFETLPPAERENLLNLKILMEAMLAAADNKSYQVINLLEPLLARQIDNRKAAVLLAQAYQKAGQNRRASRVLDQLVSRFPGDAIATIELVNSYILQGDWSNALRHARVAEAIMPKDLESMLLRLKLLELKAHVHAAAGKPVIDVSRMHALSEQLSDLIAQNPGEVEARMLRALVLFYQDKIDEASQELQEAIDRGQGAAVVNPALRLISLHLTKNTGKALPIAQSLVQKYPEFAALRVALSELQASSGQKEEANQTLRQATTELKDAEEKDTASIALAKFLLANQPRTEGLELLKQVAASRTDDVPVRRLLLEIPEVQADNAFAQNLVDELKAIEGEHGLIWRLEQARVMMRTNQWREDSPKVLEYLQFCMNADPGWSAPVMALGQFYEMARDDAKAEETYLAFFNPHPDALDVADRLLRLLQRQKRFQEAAHILEMTPGSLTTLSGHRINIAIALEHYDQAIAELRDRLAARPNDAQAYVLLGRCLYLTRRDPQVAFEQVDKALVLQPNLWMAVLTKAAILRAEGRDNDVSVLLDAEVNRRQDFSSYLLRSQFNESIRKMEAAEQDLLKLREFPEFAARAYELLGDFYARTRRVEQAATAWQEGLKAHPDDVDMQRKLVRSLIVSRDEQKQKQGQVLLQELLAKKPDDPELLIAKACQLLRTKTGRNRQQTMELLEKVVEVAPRTVPAYLQLIELAIEQGDLAHAELLIAQGRGANPKDVHLMMAQARFDQENGRVRVASELVQTVLQMDPKNVEARNFFANQALKNGNLDMAESYNVQALELDESNEEAQITRALILESRHRRENAIESLQNYRKTDVGGQSASVLVNLVGFYGSNGDFEQARLMLEEAEKLAPGSEMVCTARLTWLAAQQRYADLLAFTNERIRNGADEEHAMLAAASHLLYAPAEKDCQQARAIYTKILEKNPNQIEAYLGLVQLALRFGDFAAAEEPLRQILELAPYHQQALNNMAWILSQQLDKPEEAIKFADQGINRYPDDSILMDTRAAVLIKLHRWDEAQRELDRCLVAENLSPATRASALSQLGAVLSRDPGQAAVACKHLNEALAIDKQSPVFSAAQRQEIQERLDFLGG